MSGDLSNSRFNKESRTQPNENISQWLDRFGKNTVGEAVSVLVAGSVGSMFGPGGRLVGHRVGLIVGKRVEWHKLNEGGSQQSSQPLALMSPQEVIPAPDKSVVKADQPGQAELVVGPQEPLMLTAGNEGQTFSVIPDPPVQFTRRQLEVLFLLSSQHDTEEIAEQLGITPATVKYHKRNIYEKLRANSSAETTFVAVELEPGLDVSS